MIESKICKDCKYYQGNWDIPDMCMHPKAAFISDVDGTIHQETCSWMREDKSECGPDAVWFETYTGNRDWDDFIGFICAVAVTLLFVAAVTYGPAFIMEMMN